ncbi:MAG: complex I NDUFA9 subunit family protein [Wenzhouxiangellaceae bacterium]|nr:complex I NDUFA9 subunit family protein [Wenzhouxiangellaceae bacterium]
MKILILGGSGFVGGHLARRLERDGHRMTIATRHAPNARRLTILPGLRVRAFDPYDADRLAEELDGHDAVVNLVGILNEKLFGGGGFERAHVELPEKVVEACRRAGVGRLLHMSALNAGSDASRYLATRGEGEQRVRDSGLDWTIFRPSTIFGRDDSFLNRFASLLRFSPVLPLARPGAKFAPTWVNDVVEAFARALGSDEAVGETYELCGDETWELKAIVEWIAEQKDWRRWVMGLPDPLGRLQGRVFDFVPGRPFSSDNFGSLTVDSTCGEDGYSKLAIEPWGMSAKAVEWMRPDGKQERYQRFREQARRR